MRDTERERERERQRHRQREKQAPFREPDAGLDPGTPGSCPGLKAGAKLLTHPGILTYIGLNVSATISSDKIHILLRVSLASFLSGWGYL